MSNKEKYDNIFIECFGLKPEQVNEKLIYRSVQAWDSAGHMGMIAAIEETFDIALETDDIIEFSSYSAGIEILRKYKVDIPA
jgi:acyl carrier protein